MGAMHPENLFLKLNGEKTMTIADADGVKPEAVILYEYAGSISIPKYNKMGA